MRICVLGATGLLGKALLKEAKNRYGESSVIGVARSNSDVDLDITLDTELENFFSTSNFSIVINTVAIVNHKLCDEDVGLAYRTNARPSSLLSALALKYNFKYIYISTDGYYIGDEDRLHTETDPISLINEYARTKYIGEMFTLTNPQSLVIRTNIIGFKNKQASPTFLEWCIESLKNRNEMLLFDDYYTSSITVGQFSKILFDLVEKNACGIINLASSDVFSKKEFIEALAKILQISLNNAKIGSIKSLKGAPRAESLGLSVKKAETILGYSLPNLSEILIQIKEDYKNYV